MSDLVINEKVLNSIAFLLETMSVHTVSIGYCKLTVAQKFPDSGLLHLL